MKKQKCMSICRLMEICKVGVSVRCMAKEENSADIAIRGCQPEQVMGDETWWKGSWWLEKEDKWPQWEDVTQLEQNRVGNKIDEIYQVVIEKLK